MAYGINAPRGLQPSVTLTGAPWSGQLNEYQIQANNGASPGYATPLYTGDPIAFLNDGTIGIATPNAPVTGVFFGCKYQLPQGQSGYNGPYVFSPYWPGSITVQPYTNITALVIDDPNVLFDIQSSNSNPTGAAAATLPLGIMASNIGNNANFAIGGTAFTDAVVPQNPTAGNNINGQSNYYLDISSIGTTSNLNLKMVRLLPIITPSITNQGAAYNVFYPQGGVGPQDGNFNDVLVALNNDAYKGGYGTASGITNLTATGTITSANFLALNNPPQQLLAAIPNAVIVVNSFTLTFTTVTTAFTDGGNVGLEYRAANNLGGTNASTLQPATTFQVGNMPIGAGPYVVNFRGTPVNLAANVNSPISLSAAAVFTAGVTTNDIAYTLNYSIVPV